MKLFLFPKGTINTIFVLALTLCQLTAFGSGFSSPQSANVTPFALNSVVLSDTSVHVFWLALSTPTSWEIEIITKGTPFSGTPTHTGITTGLGAANPFLIDNLIQGTAYKYRVRANCAGVAGAWSNETRTFFTHILNGDACGIDLEIPDVSCFDPIRYPIQVRNALGTSMGSDVVLQEVRLVIEHDWLIDLEIQLLSPSGNSAVMLIDENGGTNNNFGDPTDSTCTQFLTLLNENACGEQSIMGAVPPFINQYLPLGNLNAFNDNSAPNGTWELIICDDAATNVGSLKFVELVFDQVNCTPPTGLIATAIDSTSVTFSWAKGGLCDSTIFEYGPPGFTPGTGVGILDTATCPPYTLTGLTPGSDFEFYIFENCGGNLNSACSSVSLTTDCSSPPVTVVGDFDNLPNCIGVACLNPCDINNYFWQNARNDELEWSVYQTGTFTGGTGPTTDVSGSGKYIYMEVSSFGFFGFGNCFPGDEAVLTSNCFTIDTKNTDTCHVSFNYHMFGNSIGELKFEITTDGINWTTLWSQTGNQGDQWNEVKLSLSAYDNMGAQFRFVGVRGNGTKGDIGLDEINFFGSTDNGPPSFTLFVDNDGDGFGDGNRFVQNCFNVIPPGYVTNDSDCNDLNASVFTNNTEIPCNGIDENCSGTNPIDDDEFLPPPTVSGPISVCEGEMIELVAIPGFGGTITWCDLNCFNPFIGDTLIINGLPAINGQQTTYQYTIFEEIFDCHTPEPATVEIIVNPLPIISTQDQPVICEGEVFDLSTIQITDQNNTIGNETYHSGFPADTSNFLTSPLVSPTSTQDFYIRKVANGGCEGTTLVTVTVLDAPTASIAPVQDTLETCKGIPAFLTGFTDLSSGFDQLWNTFETTTNITVNSGGVNGDINLITYTVTGQNQCSDTDSIVIKTVSSVDTILSPIITPVSTCFGNDGSIQLTPIDGVPNYQYAWSGPSPGSFPSSGGYTIPNLLQGTYSVTITDSSSEQCDFILNNLVVNGPSASVLLDDVQSTTCYGVNDGAISILVSGTNPTIAWSGGITSTSDQVTGLAAGLYNVTVTDSGCQTILSNIEVPQPDSVFALSNVETVDCFGGNNGKINLSVSGGVPNYSYNWNNAPPVKNPSGLNAGDYYFTITDSQGCTFESDTISIAEPSSLSLLINQKLDPLCFGESTGSIDVAATGGTPPYQYFWSDMGVGASRSGLAAGSYDVTVFDANDCQILETAILIDNPPLLVVDTVQITNASCFGIADGAIDMTASGGTGTLGYLWNTNDGTQDLTGLAGGDYVLTVFDGNGCRSVSDTVEIVAPNNLNVSLDTIQPFCIGTSDGGIDLEVLSGGTSPYTYLWSDSTTNEDLTNVPVGFYDVTITHANGCISTFTKIKVDAPQVIDGTNVESVSPNCFGESTGRIFSNIDDGTRPYNYSWSNGFSSQDLSNLPSGFYDLTVTDANNCLIEIDSIEIVDNDSLSVEVLALDPLLCHDDSTGGITVQAFGGNPNYTYTWNAGAFSGSNITGLPPGNYDLTVIDSVNCVFDFPTIVIENLPEIDVNYQVCLDPDCTGGLNRDSVKLTASGGVGNLQFLWSDSTTGANLINIPAGEYEVTITDENGCQIEVEEIKVPTTPASFYFDNFTKTDVSCSGSEDGSICVPIVGGIPPYQFSWSDGAGGSSGTDITNSNTICLLDEEEGVYVLTVVDSKGCIITSEPIEILEPNPITIAVMDIQHVECYGGSSGEITSEVLGGNPPFNYAWVDIQTGDSIIFTKSANSFPAGSYILRVEDSFGCTGELPSVVIINEPAPFLIDTIIIDDVKCFGDSTGSVELKISGGTPPTNVFWGVGVDTARLSVGMYEVTVSDDNGCILFPNFTINGPSTGMMFVDTITTIDPMCHDDDSGEISFNVTGGVGSYQYFVNEMLFNNPIATGLLSGVFEIKVRDSNQCEIFENVTLNNPPLLEIDIIGKSPTPGIWFDGELAANVSGGKGPYQYLWSTGDTTQVITGLNADWYFVTVTDGLGCEDEEAFQLDLSSSVETLEIDGEITLAPNPTNGLMRVDFDINSYEKFEYLIINQEGKLIQKNKVDVAFKTSLDINLTSYPSGTYYFVLQKNNAWKTWKISKI